MLFYDEISVKLILIPELFGSHLESWQKPALIYV